MAVASFWLGTRSCVQFGTFFGSVLETDFIANAVRGGCKYFEIKVNNLCAVGGGNVWKHNSIYSIELTSNSFFDKVFHRTASIDTAFFVDHPAKFRQLIVWLKLPIIIQKYKRLFKSLTCTCILPNDCMNSRLYWSWQ